MTGNLKGSPFQYILSGEKNAENDAEDLLDSDEKRFNEEDLPEEVALLPVRNTVLYPGAMLPITVARDKSIKLVRDAYNQKNRSLCVVAQKTSQIEDPQTEDLYRVGTFAHIMRLIRMPDGSVTIVIQGRTRVNIDEISQETPYLKAKISRKPEGYPSTEETRALIHSLKSEAARIIQLSPNIPSEANITLHNINGLGLLVHFIASNLNLPVQEKQNILEMASLTEKAKVVLGFLSKELQMLELSEELHSKVKIDIDKQQRDFFLRQQMKAIQDELGDQSQENEIDEMREKAALKQWPAAAAEAFEKELNKLYRINNASPEYSVSVNYLDWMLDLPWQDYTKDRFNLKVARRILDKDHFGLDKVKERIIEYLAVLKLRNDLKAPILCLYGPPGVGKTSLGKSIAKSLGRKFVRISLGGVRDEAEIRGHRRTYIGSMPGRVLQGLKKADSGNPVFVLDEIDKVGNDFRGDPASALLEVLDPEQNNAFNDHYLELDYDLSTILFVATANDISSIHPALRDRMELIEINGYTLEEKTQIALRHLLPKVKKEHGLKDGQLEISTETIQTVIEGYTRESGVRNLSQKLAAVARGVAKEIVENGQKTIAVDRTNLHKYLGIARFESELYQKSEQPGVAIGLAWTAVGGEILFIETALMPGAGRLTLTGQLGDVMKESANVAYIYLKANAQRWGIEPDLFKKMDVHIHIPAGAIPKDGPSAGVTMLTAIASAMTGRLVKPNLAMTGEITLRGKTLPVGGIKEKVLAAVRAGINTILMCDLNRKDVEEIEADHIAGIEFKYVSQMAEVLEFALETEVTAKPVIPPDPAPAAQTA